jgi:transposase-like protein
MPQTKTSPLPEHQQKQWCEDETGSLAFLFHKRWPQGFMCPYCHWQHPPSPPSRILVCSHCGHPSSITTNTILHGSKKDPGQWLQAIWWLCTAETEISAKNLQRFLHLTSYQTAWTWLQKLRMAMAAADTTPCRGLVELGCAPVLPAWEKPQQALVIAAAETIQPAGIPGRIRMSAINILTAETITTFLRTAVEPGSSLFTPDLPVYQQLDRYDLSLTEAPPDHLHRTGELIKEVEVWLNKVHRGGVTIKHLQLYLDEFCFRNNSALLPDQEAVFNLLLQGVLANKPKPYRELVSNQQERRIP